MNQRIELLAEEADGRLVLRSPEVGWFTCALGRGQLVSAGAAAGVVRSLGRTFELVVPPGTAGRVVNERPERVHAPVGYGTVLYELAPLAAEDAGPAAAAPGDAARTGGAPAFTAPHSGRFWHRSAPGDPPFVEVGSVIEAGQTIGLIEVMKTFTHLAYEPGDALPARARVIALPADDGAEVDEGDALIEVEPA